MYKNDIMIGDIFLQRGVKRVFRENGKIICIDYINDDLVNGDNNYIERSGADDIYQLYGYDMNGFKMNQYSTYGDLVFEIENISLDELNKRFIKLSDFIRDAKFVGREFRRIQPVCRYSKYKVVSNGSFRGINRRTLICDRKSNIITDRSFMDLDGNVKNIVLYMKDNMFLVKCITRFEEFYRIIDCSYVCDGNYEFIGNVYKEYMDRDKVYLEIVKQIDSYNKKCVKTKIKVK